jgi:DNA-directed RNA polymerase sigma subunit (sigma70/sigma32)
MGRSRIDGFIRLAANVLEKGCTLAKVTDELMREGNVIVTIEQIAERFGKPMEALRAAAMVIGTNLAIVRLDAPMRLEEEGSAHHGARFQP